ncbi:hypothetical protein O6H91_10G001500 [Diphasiastrum complanatum]|uniref:Uncharacterized protein n=1 Tax=Diphasiastrum complanatum TaxID=34168 RepID=A0ACC2CDL7_DIPCM|nr:hypothetical protein O6H91_10G001500 [Diphasiastrum complanatum]
MRDKWEFDLNLPPPSPPQSPEDASIPSSPCGQYPPPSQQDDQSSGGSEPDQSQTCAGSQVKLGDERPSDLRQKIPITEGSVKLKDPVSQTNMKQESPHSQRDMKQEPANNALPSVESKGVCSLSYSVGHSEKSCPASSEDADTPREAEEEAKEASLVLTSLKRRALDRQSSNTYGNGPESAFEGEKGTESTIDSAPDSKRISQERSMGADFSGQPKKSELKDVMLGKKRGRQTVFLETNESLQRARPAKILATPRSTVTPNSSLNPLLRQAKDSPRPLSNASSEKLGDSVARKAMPVTRQDMDYGSDSRRASEFPEKTSGSSEEKGVPLALSRDSSSRLGDNETKVEKPHFQRPSVRRPGESGQTRIEDVEQKHVPHQMHRSTSKKHAVVPKRHLPSPGAYQPQDASIERLHRETTSNKLWQIPGELDLQRVPGSFASVEEYVQVFEPLLFEESRAQLHSVWEELSDSSSKDVHIPVSIKNLEKRERGWYDVTVLPLDPRKKLSFKEGDIGVISTPRPGSDGRCKGRRKETAAEEEKLGEEPKRVAGTVRRYIPVDVRDSHGAILHFHVSESDLENRGRGAAISSNASSILGHFQNSNVIWYLTVLGSLATTQREYVALHAFQRLNAQMIKAMLKPQADHFPQYDQEPPAMPTCFTAPFIQRLHDNFNGPQLSAIQWAAMHTAAGSSNTGKEIGKRQEPWPFTLVQGPPGTGKTHTVWGMLNVIHLVQYQHYYAGLLKKLAPGSLSPTVDNSSSLYNDERGWIDDLLQKMDSNLARMLPKLCPKPRMLVCAPSNAATDELLSRVLDRGFIDGEMKTYRPDVARVGTDPQSRAAQAVSVERRSDQLLGRSREEVLTWLQQLRVRERNLAQNVTNVQRDLQATAAARSQGTVGVDPEMLAARDQARDSKLQQLAALVEERDKLLVEMSRLCIVESASRPGGVGIPQEEARGKLEASFASEAEVVFTTVSSSGRRLFTNLARGFDIVVIDEAAQASEVAVLPPLSLGAGRCVLVGDPQQLPATVISRVADTMQYSRSLFERFQQAGCPTIMLTVQYRMHPQIRDFPSRYFYQGRLVDSDGVKDLPDEVFHKDPMLQPYLFYDISHGRESHGGSVSYQNVVEAQFAARLYQHLKSVLQSAGTFKLSVGIISPYKLQLKCLQKEFESVLGTDPNLKEVYINTVDAFQGQERDVIIMSCVRASSHGVGFVADIRRMNVALTRARRSLWVIGNATTLLKSEDWAALITDSKTRGCFVPFETSVLRGLIPAPFPGGNHTRDSGLLQIPRHGGALIRNMHAGVQFAQEGKDGKQVATSKVASYGKPRQKSQGSQAVGQYLNGPLNQQRHRIDRDKDPDHGQVSK